MLIIPACAAHADPSTDQLKKTAAFDAAFARSFTLDACGNKYEGELFRKAIAEKVDSCPFPAEVKEKFHATSKSVADSMTAKIEQYVKENGKLPDHLNGVAMSCAQYRQSDEYVLLHTAVTRYSRHEISFSEIMPDSCELVPGGL